MITETNNTIQILVGDLNPVRPLPSPSRRALTWFVLSVPYVLAIVTVFSLRSNLGSKLMEWRYVMEEGAALFTALLAAWAAFSMTIPGYTPLRAVIPLLPLVFWIGILGEGCARDFLTFGWNAMPFTPDWVCLPIIILIGAWPGILMIVMLRRGAPLVPHRTIAMGALASAGLGNVALRLLHRQDVSLTVLVWQVGRLAAQSQ